MTVPSRCLFIILNCLLRVCSHIKLVIRQSSVFILSIHQVKIRHYSQNQLNPRSFIPNKGRNSNINNFLPQSVRLSEPESRGATWHALSMFHSTGSQLSFLGFVSLPVLLLGTTSRALCVHPGQPSGHMSQANCMHTRLVLELVYMGMLSEKDVYVCESLKGLNRKIRSKVKQNGAGKNSTCP